MEKFLIKFDPIEDLNCSNKLCTFAGVDVQDLFKHYRICHKNDQNLQSPCLYSRTCFNSNKFQTFSGLNQHLRRYHDCFFRVQQVDSADMVVQNSNTNENCENRQDSALASCESGYTVYNHPGLFQTSHHPLQFQAGKFILSMLASNKHTEYGITSMLPQVQGLINEALKTYSQKLKNELSHNEEVQTILNSIEVPNIFKGLTTSSGQTPFFIKRFGLVAPKTIQLPCNPRKEFGRHKIGKEQSFKRQTYIYIPFLEQLTQLLNVNEIFDEIFLSSEEISRPGIYTKYQDGIKYKTSEFFRKHPRALRILLYLDEVQVCNPLGSKTHKLVFVYFTLLNFPPSFRSSLKSIYLVAIFYAEQVASYDINEILRHFREELSKLEDGVNLLLIRGTMKVYGALVAIAADNLASHQYGGFKAAFSRGFRKCRTCLALDEDIQNKFCDSEFEHRSVENHKEQCKQLSSGGLAEHFSKIYGINHNSVFNTLKYFHVIQGLPPDPMHDLLEGVVPFVICRVLKLVINKKGMKLEAFNHLIQNYKYGQEEIRNRPSPIKANHLKNDKLRQSSSQIWLLMQLLPLLVVNRVPDMEKSLWWKAFKNVSEICRIALSDVITNYDLLSLRWNVSTFLIKMKKLDTRITPKMHNLVHYPYYITLLGPLRQFWCMRFEGKHAYFKTVARTTGNFINVPKTLAKRHQYWLTHQLGKKEGFLRQDITYSRSSKRVVFTTLEYWGQIASVVGKDYPQIICLDWAEFNFTTRVKPLESVLLCPMNGSIAFKFGIVVALFYSIDMRQVLIVCKMLLTKRFNQRYQAFEVKTLNNLLVFNSSSLTTMQTFTLHKSSYSNNGSHVQRSKTFIVSKENLKNQLL